jgi:hypothetical protein
MKIDRILRLLIEKKEKGTSLDIKIRKTKIDV